MTLSSPPSLGVELSFLPPWIWACPGIALSNRTRWEVVKNLLASAGDLRGAGSILGSGRSPGGGHATHSSAWGIAWTEEPGRLRSMGSQRLRHDWAAHTHTHTHTHTPWTNQQAFHFCSFFLISVSTTPFHCSCTHTGLWLLNVGSQVELLPFGVWSLTCECLTH